jgi:hypothetical protein
MEENEIPNVFPTPEQIAEANALSGKLNEQIFEKLKETGKYDELKDKFKDEIPNSKPIVSQGELDAAAEMKRKTDELIKFTKENDGKKPLVVRPDLAEQTTFQAEIEYGQPKKPIIDNFKINEEIPQPTYEEVKEVLKKIENLELIYEKLSQPQADVPFDVIPLPSKGKIYKNKKSTMNVAYLNASDENILTNPNIMQSGKFLEILFNRKMMDTDLRYRDLHVGDRNAIMIWLRSTAYGTEYPIQVFDPKTGKQFETNIDLSKLKIIYLDVDTDKNGYIDFILPTTKHEIKFKLLTVGDELDIEEYIEKIKKDPNLGPEFVETSTHILKKQIKSVNGNTDTEFINNYVDKMRLGDVRALRKYIDGIESGMDMTMTVKTPGGESIKTYFPLNPSFFWPDI